MEIVALFISTDHVYTGHFGGLAGRTPMVARDCLQLEPGQGILGDRYHRRIAGHKGQITFFAEETWLRLRDALGVTDRGPGVFRRNVVVRAADLNGLIGRRFELQGAVFEGSEYCKPCVWMDQAFAPGAFRLMTEWGAGGLRARVILGGALTVEAPAPGEGMAAVANG